MQMKRHNINTIIYKQRLEKSIKGMQQWCIQLEAFATSYTLSEKI